MNSLQPSVFSCQVERLGLLDYQSAWDYQRTVCQALIANLAERDRLLLLQHPPVYTLGMGSSLDYVRFDLENCPAPLHRTERGGEVTYHCPGQLVGYPILNLHRYRLDLHWYLRQLEEVLLRVVGGYGLTGQRISGLTGVWVQGVKVAAIGIKVKKWVTMHGFALNVCPDLSGFEQIVPCGLRDRAVGRLVDFVPELTLPQVERDLIVQFGQVFGCHMEIQR